MFISREWCVCRCQTRPRNKLLCQNTLAESESAPDVLRPVLPVVAAGELFVDMMRAQFGECGVQRAVRINEWILRSAIEADRRKLVVIRPRPVQQVGIGIARILKILGGKRNKLR